MNDQQPFTTQSLECLYARVSAPEGVTVGELRAMVEDFGSRPRAQGDVQAYREGRQPWKKLRDEIVPVEQFLSSRYPDEAHVRLPLNDLPTDAWLTIDEGEPIGIEVTGALSRAGIEIGRTLAEGVPVPGFIGLQDDAKQVEFEKAKARGRVTHSAKGVNETIDRAVEARLAGKNKQKFEGQILLITAPIGSSPNRDETEMQAALGHKAAALPFAEVHVLDRSRKGRMVQLK
jgi:hypothetical protein